MANDLKDFTDDLSKVKLIANPEEQSTRPLDNVAFYDFAFYEFLTSPEIAFKPSLISDAGVDFIAFMEGHPNISFEDIEWIRNILEVFENSLYLELRRKIDIAFKEQLNGIFLALYFGDNSVSITNIISYSKRIEAAGGDDKVKSLIYQRATANALNNETDLRSNRFGDILENSVFVDTMHFEWGNLSALVETLEYPLEHPFEVFPNRSVNLGLRLLYRQEWKPLGEQPGEIVRTIPLGPGQKERVTTKIVRRQKRTSTLETVTETETTTETNDTTKDSSEIVNEAKDTSNWSENVHVNASFFGIGANSTTVFGGSSEDQSKNTSSHLSETMRKTASKIRRQTKVVVTTESEVSFEQENFSEISNPNNEIAITYEYHKLQQQYEVFTYMADVQSVIFVAEQVPLPAEVNEEWIRKYDWIIAKVLKDESFRSILNDLIQDVQEEDPLNGIDPANNPFLKMHDAAEAKFAHFEQPGAAQGQGLSIPDIYAEPQRIYQQHLRESAERARANKMRVLKRNRLFQHIRDNILYYCRAIWIHEDSDQRLLRYRKEGRRVPIEWQGPMLSVASQIGLYKPTGTTAPLEDIIDPTGPIGYSGNYAVFLIRPRPRINILSPREQGWGPEIRLTLEDVLAMMRFPYHDDNGDFLDPALKAFINDAEKLKKDYEKLSDAEKEKLDHQKLIKPNPEETIDILSYLPHLGKEIKNDQDRVVGHKPDEFDTLPIIPNDYGKYLYRKNGTRRFLVDSNNLYLNIRASEGAALESFKRAHRYIDVLKEYENLVALIKKNERREKHMDNPGTFDPDLEKVVIVDSGDSSTGRHAALHAAMTSSVGTNSAPSTPTVGVETAPPTPVTATTSSPASGTGTDINSPS